MKIGIMYVSTAERQVSRKNYDIVKDFRSHTLDFAPSDRYAEGQQHTVDGCCQGAKSVRTKYLSFQCCFSATHARETSARPCGRCQFRLKSARHWG